MSTKQELERLLVDLVVVWPADDKSPEIEAARSYLQTYCGITIQSGSIAYDMHQDEHLTDNWYSI